MPVWDVEPRNSCQRSIKVLKDVRMIGAKVHEAVAWHANVDKDIQHALAVGRGTMFNLSLPSETTIIKLAGVGLMSRAIEAEEFTKRREELLIDAQYCRKNFAETKKVAMVFVAVNKFFREDGNSTIPTDKERESLVLWSYVFYTCRKHLVKLINSNFKQHAAGHCHRLPVQRQDHARTSPRCPTGGPRKKGRRC